MCGQAPTAFCDPCTCSSPPKTKPKCKWDIHTVYLRKYSQKTLCLWVSWVGAVKAFPLRILAKAWLYDLHRVCVVCVCTRACVGTLSYVHMKVHFWVWTIKRLRVYQESFLVLIRWISEDHLTLSPPFLFFNLYNIVLVSAIQQHESYTLCLEPPSLPHISHLHIISEHQTGLPVLHRNFSPATHPTHDSVPVLMLLSPFVSSSPAPMVPTSPSSTSASLIPSCKQAHQYHFSWFHIYALTHCMCFSLSDFTLYRALWIA